MRRVVAAALTVMMIAVASVNQGTGSNRSIGSEVEVIKPPSSDCTSSVASATYKIERQAIKVASIGKISPSFQQVVADLESRTSKGQQSTARVGGVALTMLDTLVSTARAAEGRVPMRVLYLSDYINFVEYGTATKDRSVSGSDRWLVYADRVQESTFGASDGPAVGELIADTASPGSPMLCIVSMSVDELSTGRMRIVGVPVANPAAYFPMVNIAGTGTCKYYGTKKPDGRYPGYVCPAARTYLVTNWDKTWTWKNSSGSLSSSFSIDTGIADSEGYIKCDGNAVCKLLNTGSLDYGKYRYYESTRANLWFEVTATLTATATSTYTSPKLVFGPATITVPACTAVTLFLVCEASGSLELSASATITASGTARHSANIGVWGTAKLIQWQSDGRWEATGDGDAFFTMPNPTLTGSLTARLDAPILTATLGLKVAAVGNVVWAQGRLLGTVKHVLVFATGKATTDTWCSKLDGEGSWGFAAWTGGKKVIPLAGGCP